MPKVKLSESELRKIILASLQEADAADAAPAPDEDARDGADFYNSFKISPALRKEFLYLFNALAQ